MGTGEIGTITVAFEDGGVEYSAKELVQAWWGDMAGGHPGIAGSPRGRKMTQEDWKMTQKRMKALYSQAKGQRIYIYRNESLP